MTTVVSKIFGKSDFKKFEISLPYHNSMQTESSWKSYPRLENSLDIQTRMSHFLESSVQLEATTSIQVAFLLPHLTNCLPHPPPPSLHPHPPDIKQNIIYILLYNFTFFKIMHDEHGFQTKRPCKTSKL